ncbi:alginate lyase family protein [Streptomyces sp. NPDC091265]|uniref:alginate lyase family protein n=1 Tax=unclassified Streptomyces TaxID=2593676 RepID=UPI003450D652
MRPGTIGRGLGLATALAALITGLSVAPASAGRAAPDPGAAAPAARAAAPAAFTHPGVLVSRPQLDFVRAKVQAGAQPWKSAFDQMMASKYASLTRTAKPRAVVECGSYSNPNYGCTDEREDAIAAYTLSLAWYLTQDSRYATKAIGIMDAWSAVIKDHTNSNAPLQTGWAGSSWPRAAEIIKYTYSGWPNAGRFSAMLRDVYLPKVINGSNSNGNWELSMTEAAIGISVFLEDRTSYDKAVSKFRGRVPAYIYLTSDGALPKTAPGSGLDTRDKIINYWQGQSTFMDGLSQETCRDLTHTGYGLSAISHIAETSRIQGQGLYPETAERLRQALGLHAKYQLGTAVPSSLCGGSLKDNLGPVTEVGFNALHNRMGIAMTNTQALTEQRRPAGTDNLFVAWETLTHADNPS